VAVRLKDVAARAGVSIKTVSNVVHDYEHVAADTRARVQRAIEELGYRPNLSARNLRAGRSGLIALAVPELVSPYFAELTAAVIAAAREHAITVLVEDTGGDADTELRIASGLGTPLLDGVILSPLRLDKAALLARPRAVPLVLLGERDYELACDHVLMDSVAAAREATAHLVGLGRRRIAALGAQADPRMATARQRLRGYADALADAGLPADPALTPPVVSYHRADGAAGLHRLLALADPPDAVLCFNDLLALGVLRAAYECGLRVPQDLAVVGIDDIEEASYAIPSLTTIAPDRAGLAREAVAALVARITGGPGEPARRLVGHRLIIRESTAGRG
jgi:DNA-binding LacI/PurR family transcriptional regulator